MSWGHSIIKADNRLGFSLNRDLDAGVPISHNAARLFCNLTRSYLSFVVVEHQRLSRQP
jgi:hypothetical protein